MALRMEATNGGVATGNSDSNLSGISPETDRRNGYIFFISYWFIYLAAPVLYVDVVQAALCDKLGANATLANLPSSAYLFGCLAPILLTWVLPYRLERAAVVAASLATAGLSSLVCLFLVLPIGNSLRLSVVIGQGLIMGILSSVAQVYMYQCLGRGTTLGGRARALKLTFTFSPIAAVAGSLGAQFVLNRGLSFVNFPYDFALLYFISVPCMIVVGLVSARYKLVAVKEETRKPFLHYIVHSVRSFSGVRPLLMLWLGYAFWYATLAAMPNLSLYTRHAIGRDPKELSGLMMALRFGSKSLGGFALGAIMLRKGVRAPLIVTVLLVGAAVLWVWAVPGYFYLLAFGLLGAGELGGAYFPNYALAVSSPATGARDQALLSVAAVAASLSAAFHGILTDTFGFPASFVFGTATAGLALWVVLRLPSPSSQRQAQSAG